MTAEFKLRVSNAMKLVTFLVPCLRVIKSRRFRWAGHVARMEEVGVLSKF